MAVNLFCYLSKSVDETTRILELLRTSNDIKFGGVFSISNAIEADVCIKEIASEHGFAAMSYFVVGLLEKQSASLIPKFVEEIKSLFNIVLVLHENEFLM